MGKSDVAIVIPAWNEEETIAKVVSQVLEYGKAIVVDDASTDQTSNEAEKAGAIVVKHSQNMGYDEALNSGFVKAHEEGCKYVITFDADGQHSNKAIEACLKPLTKEGVPLVIGKRPRKARLAEVLIGIYCKLRFNVHDILCGVKGYDIELWLRNGRFDHVKSIGAELSMASIKRGYNFEEVDISIFPRSGNARFGNRIQGNIKIMKGFLRLLLMDITGIKSDK